MREYECWLALVEGISHRKKQRIYEFYEEGEALYKAVEKGLKSCPHVDFNDILKLQKARKLIPLDSLHTLEKSGIHFTGRFSEDFPGPLRYIHDCPFGLFYKGILPKSFESAVAIVGARMCSAYGRSAATDLGFGIGKAGGIVVSGMARGIDCASHAGALRAEGVTVAVLGCGVDICYPSEAKNIYMNIQEKGCIMSDLPPKTPPLPAYFPQRNRIISGLSRAVLVIEAAIRSGSLITADLALEQGKDIFALPGRISDRLSEGTNRLIAQGAGIIDSITEFPLKLMEAGYLCSPTGGNKGAEGADDFFVLEKDEEVVYSCLDFSPVGLDELMQRCGATPAQISQGLMGLAEKGLIRREGFGCYVRQGIEVQNRIISRNGSNGKKAGHSGVSHKG